jgi:hypothetical protein
MKNHPSKLRIHLLKMYNTNTQAHKMQLKQELHNLQKNKMNINDYSTKVKNLADVFAMFLHL